MSTKKLKILMVSVETSPYAKTGGLADVAGSLPKALTALGHDVRIVMPKYRQIKADFEYVADFPVQLDTWSETCIVRKTLMPNQIRGKNKDITVYFTDSYRYFDRNGIYGHHDDGERFIFFCKAVLKMLPQIGFQPDIIHCNDWHTGPLCLLLKEEYAKDEFYSKISTIFTIHNLEYQGHFPPYALKLLNQGYEIFTAEKSEFYGMFNFMKAGLVYSDIINTVSAVYAQEIQTPQYGERLDGLLQKRSADLYGILNGINYEEFDPEQDPSIVQHYSAETFKDKKKNKTALQKEMGLPVSDAPVFGLVSRLSGQKGLDLILERAGQFLSKDVQFVLLGAGDAFYQDAFKWLMTRFPGKIAANIGFNAAMAQRIYAGCDMFLMPSRFEPCGLGQLISLRYGTIPIVRETGGLAETIHDYDSDPKNGNGFTFDQFSADDLMDAIDRALDVYSNKPKEWDELVVRALKSDYSWAISAKKYEDIYYIAKKRKS